MKPVTINQNSQAIVYDADVLPEPGADWFDPEYWRARGLLTATAPGRGTAFFIDAPGGEAVLRRYLRGGWVARVSYDQYIYTGLESSRPFAEFDLLKRMMSAGLNVPAPLAAMTRRQGLFYTGALITRRIPRASALAEHFGDRTIKWQKIGRDLRAFHEAGMDHADLNARNILLQADTGITWLLDLDRSTFRAGEAVDGASNLARLQRSMIKLWPAAAPPLEAVWAELLEGYHA